MNIFLGEPPANIKQWIIEHYTPPTPAAGPLCFTAEQDGSSVSLVHQDYGFSDPTPPNLQYSLNDTEHWTEYEINQIIPLAKDAKVFFKANGQNERISGRLNMNTHIYQFVMEGKIAASGNVQYLLDDTGSRTDVPSWCYNSMFKGCTSLTQAPALLATTLADTCYCDMFNSCTSLTQAPALPATTLAESCYMSMFEKCTSLTQAPALPATTLAETCYAVMFALCSSLTQAPALPATTLANNCYINMFYDCSKFSECHMKASMEGVYNTSTHGDTTKTVIYDL